MIILTVQFLSDKAILLKKDISNEAKNHIEKLSYRFKFKHNMRLDKKYFQNTLL